jgi:hypothetical protein
LDFTFKKYKSLLSALIDKGYTFQTFEDFSLSEMPACVILRHDVDKRPLNALRMSEIEKNLDISASYHFRYPSNSGYEKAIRQIASQGHEIGYHYEEMDIVTKSKLRSFTRLTGFISSRSGIRQVQYIELVHQAFDLFRQRLDHMRKSSTVKIISMHGSPLSPYDNRDIWKFHNYRNLGVICEAYLDIDYSKVLYLTDTGRRWDGDRSNIRDKPATGFGISAGALLRDSFSLSSTNDIINACKNNLLPPYIVINTHPQRWNDNIIIWLEEALKQNTKNFFKRLLYNRGTAVRQRLITNLSE